jgi:Asp-tRNA(Asn)/Glu-tRNA(Gln) amidotransferase A subunit family amidase
MPVITPEILAAAESLLGITYTPAERTQMLDNFLPQIEAALRRRATTIPFPVGPATRFDPRLPSYIAPEMKPFDFTPEIAPLPAADEDIAFAPTHVQSGWIKSKQLTSERLTKIYLDRITRHNPTLNAFATVTAGSAITRAAELDGLTGQNISLGPVHGIPYGLKDVFDTAGVTTGWGAEPYQHRIPAEDSFVAKTLHEAGCVLLGKTAVGALAYGDLWYGGRTKNPYNPAEGSSGSSAGSAADTALILHALNTPDAADPFQIFAPFGGAAPVKTLRLGYFPADFAAGDTTQLERDALETARSLGLPIIPLARQNLPYDSLMALLFAEAAAAFEDLTLSGQDDLLTWQDADAWPNSFRKSRFLSAVDHVQADRLRRLVMLEMDEIFRQVDLIIGPSLAGPMLTITNFTGHPSLCLPAGYVSSPTRPPVSLARHTAPRDQAAATFEIPHAIALYAPLHAEAALIAFAEALEPILPPKRRPALP